MLVNIFKFVVFSSVGLGLMYLAFHDVDFRNIVNDFKRANYFYVVLAALLGYLAFVSLGLRWLILLDAMGYKKVKPWNSINAIAICYFTNLFVLRAGEIARCAALNRTNGIPMSKLIGNVILERVLDFLILLSTLLITVFIERDAIFGFFSTVMENPDSILYKAWIWVRDPRVLGILAAAGTIFILLIFVFKRQLSHTLFYRKVAGFLRGIFDGIKTIGHLKHKWAFIGYTLFTWLMYYMMIFVIKFALPETSTINVSEGFFLLAIGGVAQVMPAQGGIGAYHLAIKTGLLLFAIPAITPAIALSFATLAHTTQMVMYLISGPVALYFISRATAKRLHEKALAKKAGQMV